MSVFPLRSEVRDYAWGARTGLSEVLGRAPSGGPEAELWMGAHAAAPSRILDADGAEVSLRDLLRSEPHLLGAGRDELSYLFKILASAEPLSLQVHPSKAQAERGFSEEERAGVPLAAPHRNYKDTGHKPELLLALSNFSALCGFLPRPLMLRRLEQFGLTAQASPLRDAVLGLRRTPGAQGLSAFFGAIFRLDSVELETAVNEVARRCLDHGDPAKSPFFEPALKRFSCEVLRLIELYGHDPGVLAALLLHHVELRRGEGLYLPAGVLHSYLGGVGLEIMASSDNVLRGGLTEKNVDVRELLRVLSFHEYEPQLAETRTTAYPGGAFGTRYLTEAPEFELSLLSLCRGSNIVARGPDILLVLDGKIEVSAGARVLSLEKGQHVFCAADEEYRLRGEGQVARASTGSALGSAAELHGRPTSGQAMRSMTT